MTLRCWKDCSVCLFLNTLEGLFSRSVPKVMEGLFCLCTVYVKMLGGLVCEFVTLEGLFCLSVP